jgi:hypothetical protein
MSDLFAGKIHALLCRPWVTRVKGRDWYDFVWYIARQTPVNLLHLKQRLIQTDAWPEDNNFTYKDLIHLLNKKIETTDFVVAKKDIEPFLQDKASIVLWSTEFFLGVLAQLQYVK